MRRWNSGTVKSVVRRQMADVSNGVRGRGKPRPYGEKFERHSEEVNRDRWILGKAGTRKILPELGVTADTLEQEVYEAAGVDAGGYLNVGLYRLYAY
jgi:hypothetical protein